MPEFFDFGGVRWRVFNRIAEPADLVAVKTGCDALKPVFARRKVLMVRYVTEFLQQPAGLWYVVQRRFVPLERLSANTRSKLRRGLKNFEVRKITRAFLAELGYGIYRRNFGIRPGKPLTREQFARVIEYLPPEYEFIGVFDRESGGLAGYSQVYCGSRYVQLRVISILQEAKRRYAAYAFFYAVSQTYVREQGKTVVLGLRSLVRHTEVQDFVVDKFGYERLYVKMNVCLSFPGRVLYVLARPVRKLLGLLPLKSAKYLAAFAEFVYLARSSEN